MINENDPLKMPAGPWACFLWFSRLGIMQGTLFITKEKTTNFHVLSRQYYFLFDSCFNYNQRSPYFAFNSLLYNALQRVQVFPEVESKLQAKAKLYNSLV
jgi:hypothetical protein